MRPDGLSPGNANATLFRSILHFFVAREKKLLRIKRGKKWETGRARKIYRPRKRRVLEFAGNRMKGVNHVPRRPPRFEKKKKNRPWISEPGACSAPGPSARASARDKPKAYFALMVYGRRLI